MYVCSRLDRPALDQYIIINPILKFRLAEFEPMQMQAEWDVELLICSLSFTKKSILLRFHIKIKPSKVLEALKTP